MSLQIARDSVSEITEPAFVVDLSGMIMAYNAPAAELFGWRSGAKVGSQFTELIADQPSSITLRQFLEESTGRSRQIKVPNPQGDLIAVTSTITKRPIGNELAYRCSLIEVHHEDATLESLSEFEQLTAHLPGVLFKCEYSRDRDISFISETIEEFTGYRAQDLVAGDVKYSDLMSPEDEMSVWAAVGDAFHANTSYTAEYRIRHTDGTTTWVSENGSVVPDRHGVPRFIVGSIADNQEIKTAAVEFEGTVTALSRASAVVEFDLDGRVLSANDNFLALTQYTEDELIGHHHSMLTPSSTHETDEYRDFWEKLSRGESVTGEFLRISRNGDEVWIQATYNPIFDTDGNPYKVVKFATDLTERRAMEAELRVAMEQAENAVKARGSFVANMSHEIRTPMNAVIGFTEALLDTQVDAQQERYLRLVLNSSRSLLRLLNEVLDQSKLDRGAVELEFRTFSIKDLGEQVTSSLHVGASNKALKLECVIDESVPPYLHGDSLRIQQVYLNLLSNAIKFTERGRVALEISYAEGNLISVISDTGVGMSQEYLDRLFEPYSQSDSSTSRRHGGTGLGTAISLQLVELMGGTIEVDSELGVGTAFTIRLPIPEGKEEDTLDNEIEVELPQLNILCADDIPANLELLELTLGRLGHSVVRARDGYEMIALYKKERFDLVLSDLQMPGMDGYEATMKIRTYERENALPKVPVIALSAHVLEEYRQRAYAAGMDGFAFKPLDPRNLKLEMARVLGLLDESKSHYSSASVRIVSNDKSGQTESDTDSGTETESDTDSQTKDTEKPEPETATAGSAAGAGVAAGAAAGAEEAEAGGGAGVSADAGGEAEEAEAGQGAFRQAALIADEDLEQTPQESTEELEQAAVAEEPEQAAASAEPEEAVAAVEAEGLEAEAVIDWEAGLALWGDRKILTRSIVGFVNGNDTAPATIRDAVEGGDLETAKAVAHRVCGAAGNLRLRYVQRLAKDVENELKNGEADVDVLVSELDEAIKEVGIEITEEAQLQEEQKPETPETFTPEQLKEIDLALDELDFALKRNRLSKDALGDLEPLIPAEEMQELHHALDNFDFPSALEIVKDMKARFVNSG